VLRHPRRLLTLCTLTVVLRLPSFVRPILDNDEGSYAAIACRMLDGALLYRDGIENKFPGMFYVYYAVFSVFGRYNMLAVHLATALVALLTALACGGVAARLATPRAGWLTALFYAIFSTFYYPKMLAGNAEMFAVLPCALAVLAYVHAGRRFGFYFVAGALAGVALLFKQVAFAMLLALLADRAVRALRSRMRDGLRDLALLALGAGLVVLGCVAWLRHLGVLQDAIFWTWTYVWKYYIPSGLRDHGFGFNLLTAFIPYLLAVSPLVLLAMWARQVVTAPLWWWLAGMTGAALMGGRMYGHYFLLMVPALAALGGIGADLWLGEPSPVATRRKRLLTAVTTVGAIGFLLSACLVEPATGAFWSPRPDYLQAADYVKRTTRPDDRVFVWGWFPPLYVMADRCPSTRFVYTHVLSGGQTQGSASKAHNVTEGWEMLMSDLGREPPSYIMDTSAGEYGFEAFPIQNFSRLWSFVQSGYEVDTEIAGVRIYKRRGGFAGPQAAGMAGRR
jgi:4-amino-4-deoxy-L-arabinose transferase-like glycosyltransferase